MDKTKTIEQHVNHIKDISGYFLTDRNLIDYIRFRPGNWDVDVVKDKIKSVANHERVDYFLRCGFPNHIEKSKIDNPLAQGRLSIAISVALNGKNSFDYETIEFASKYCAVHAPAYFPLWNAHSLKITQAYCHKTFLPSEYLAYSAVIQEMKSKYSMDPLNYFDISKFFWIYYDYLIQYFQDKH